MGRQVCGRCPLRENRVLPAQAPPAIIPSVDQVVVLKLQHMHESHGTYELSLAGKGRSVNVHFG